MTENKQNIIILDFGGQYSMLIARRVREARVYCEVLPYNTSPERIKKKNPAGIILSGGPGSVYLNNAPKCDRDIFSGNIPVLGICYGMQLMAVQLKGSVVQGKRYEYGKTAFKITKHDPLFNAPFFKDIVPEGWMSHQDEVTTVPPGFSELARSLNGTVAAMGDTSRNLFGLQFHPEVSHTPGGMHVIKSFLYDICGCLPTWTPQNFISSSIEKIKTAVKPGERVLCALSGGIDSSVVAFLLDQAVGDRYVAIFVDHGLLRKGEAEKIKKIFKERLQGEFIAIDATQRFFHKLKGIENPEDKRKIIGSEFINVFKDKALSLGKIDYLAQGTIYPDVIESGTDPASVTIKSHHNVGGLPEELGFKLIEPLRELFKDEVRLVAKEMGLPEVITSRQPFPGPGLAVRIIGDITEKKVKILQEADAILRQEVKNAGLTGDIWQYFAVLTGIEAVGIKNEKRLFGPVIALRAVTSEDGMTADWARLPYDFLHHVSRRITDEIPDLARVVYDVTSKPPGTIEWE